MPSLFLWFVYSTISMDNVKYIVSNITQKKVNSCYFYSYSAQCLIVCMSYYVWKTRINIFNWMCYGSWQCLQSSCDTYILRFLCTYTYTKTRLILIVYAQLLCRAWQQSAVLCYPRFPLWGWYTHHLLKQIPSCGSQPHVYNRNHAIFCKMASRLDRL